MSSKLYPYSCLALAMILVGSTVTASKVIADGLSPFVASALRLAFALPLFLGLMYWRGLSWPRPGWRDGMLLVAQAAAGSVGYTVLLIEGLRLTSASSAGVIMGLLPVVAALFSLVVLRERPSWRLLAALGLATSGVLLVTTAAGGGTGSWLGNLLVLGAVASEALFILLNKALRRPVEPLVLSTLMCAIGLLLTAIPAFFEPALRFGAASLAVLYYAIVPTVGGYLLWYAGAARVSASEASLFTALVPVSALLFAVLLLGERVGAAQLVGVACVLASMASLWLPLSPSRRKA